MSVRTIVAPRAASRVALVALALTAGGSGCSSSAPGTLHVCAAASLRAAFEAVDADFAKATPGLAITLNTAGSQTLKSQVEAGAPCDVLATADEATMGALVASKHVAPAQRFASNSLVVVTPTSNPGKLTSWKDLQRAARIALAAPEVPIGKYARTFLAHADARAPGFKAAVEANTKTLELDVAHVVMRVKQGEVDAGIVYKTDVTEGLAALPVPPELDVTADYPIAVVSASKNRATAEAYVAYVLGPGRTTLEARGFGAPRPAQ